MPRKYIKATLSLAIVAATIISFIFFFVHHPEVGLEIKKVSLTKLILLVGLYGIFTASIGVILNATVKLCGATLPKSESLLVTMYSAIINFFGPLQSGPAFRAAYLKKKHNVSLKLYGVATLGYYAVYGAVNLILLLSGWSVWLLALIPLGILLIGFLLPKLNIKILSKLSLSNYNYLCVATLLQITILTIIFYIELHGINNAISIKQAIVYSGAANLALFVSLTPGAIGFRESFLFFSQRLHHISSDTIVAANLLDRSAYITMLLVITVYLFASHTQTRLRAATKS